MEAAVVAPGVNFAAVRVFDALFVSPGLEKSNFFLGSATMDAILGRSLAAVLNFRTVF